ncbi:MAG: hypothetical protein FJZ63_01480 [Chlamydiae bacterium]|nr:hypothetical protein [Chlamydiota bacterium]
MYRIMSFDGGGVRGALTVQLLQKLSQERDFLQSIDLFVGTSTGALIALGLGFGMTPEELLSLYQNLAQVIFQPYKEKGCKYDATLLKQLMVQHVFPESLSLKDLKKKVLVPAFKLEGAPAWTPHYFHNFTSKDAEAYAVDAILASAAAPLYFPSYQGFIDGGVFATNPGMLGICKALEYNKELTLQDIGLFSLGTGESPSRISGDTPWGVEKWLEAKPQGTISTYPLFSLMTEGTVGYVDKMSQTLLKERYCRLNPPLERLVNIDDWEQIPYLLDKANSFPLEHKPHWEQAIRWITF